MKQIAALFMVAGALAAAALPASAVVSFDGKSTSFHTITAAPLPAVSAPVLAGTIAKGKKGNVLKINAMVTSEFIAPGATWALNAFVDVNGTATDPTLATPPMGAVQDCSSDSVGPYAPGVAGCTVAGTWIFDIDAAELAVPGCCYGLPLTVTLFAGPVTNAALAGTPTSASLAVQMMKKK